MSLDPRPRTPLSLWLRRSDREGGASAVEFALLLIPSLLLVFGGIEFGLVFTDKAMLGNAVREGARHAMFYPEETEEIESKMANSIAGFDRIEDEGRWSFDVSCFLESADELGDEILCGGEEGPGVAGDGDFVVVEATIEHPYVTPAPGMSGLGTEINLTETTRMRIEK